jgi:hypothetical protein
MRKFPPLKVTEGLPVVSTHPRVILAFAANLLLKLPRPDVSTLIRG